MHAATNQFNKTVDEKVTKSRKAIEDNQLQTGLSDQTFNF